MTSSKHIKQTKPLTLFWFRRDLRIDDNVGLYKALSGDNKVMPIFIFDTNILNQLSNKDDARVSIIHRALEKLSNTMGKHKCNIGMYLGKPKDVFEKITAEYPIAKVIANHDYEPYAQNRDSIIKKLLALKGIEFETFKDQVIFEKNEIVKDDGLPYKVYTPYSKKWLTSFELNGITHYNSETLLANLAPLKSPQIALPEIGFIPSDIEYPVYNLESTLVENYNATRDYPSLNGTSKIGVHLRFGALSIRKIAAIAAMKQNNTFLKELIWREFFMQILWHFPHTVNKCFKPQYERIEWRNNEDEFKQWCDGNTGYPFVDAGMRELNATGFMHNRVRMIVGSFLCKHLLIDWRWGEAYFAEKLLDYELSSNIGNWQWVAGCGVDAAPYFRIFNPTEQIKKFDKQLQYIKKWVPNYQELTYPQPIVDHKIARERCLNVYKTALNN